MVTIRVKNGMPETLVSLCMTCFWGLRRKGFRESEEEIFCRMLEPNQRVPFAVSECTKYYDTSRTALNDMEEIAWVLQTKTAGRSVGFFSGEKPQAIERENVTFVPAPRDPTDAAE